MTAPSLAAIVAGILLLGFGRRLYWLLVGVVGFGVGFVLAAQALVSSGRVLALIVGLLAGAALAFLAVFFQKVLLTLAGLAVGGYCSYWLLHELGVEPGLALWVLVAVTALAGALLVPAIFQLALVILSSSAGAVLVVHGLDLGAAAGTLLFLLLAVAGILFQLLVGRGGRRRKKKED